MLYLNINCFLYKIQVTRLGSDYIQTLRIIAITTCFLGKNCQYFQLQSKSNKATDRCRISSSRQQLGAGQVLFVGQGWISICIDYRPFSFYLYTDFLRCQIFHILIHVDFSVTSYGLIIIKCTKIHIIQWNKSFCENNLDFCILIIS